MNRLQYETSPYLLQHAENPVDWYPWGDEAFVKAKAEDKPVFLSVGYSTCHWCHVMAHESFEDAEVAKVLNRDYVCVKVDKEERPDIASIYMNVCIAVTGSGGWPLTVIMDPVGKPFFAGTYFPKRDRYRMPGLINILEAIAEQWKTGRGALLDSSEKITAHINAQGKAPADAPDPERLIEQSIAYFRSAFDPQYGGFGRAPKFPTPHNLLFLLEAYQNLHDKDCLNMAEKTLLSMAKGGIFDHIGFGFSRYSTDEKWLAPHFEKMLYDNALLIMAYTKAFEVTGNPIYKTIADKTITYIQREMTHPDGGLYSAQDADSDGVEGKYYVFTPKEIMSVLGEADGTVFCELYDITESGNFEGKSIPNQIDRSALDDSLLPFLSKLYEYRKTRTSLHKDDKILTAWNALIIAALADAASVFDNHEYLVIAERAADFIETHLREKDHLLASYRDGRRSESGFIDDYAFFIYAQLRLYQATLDEQYLERARTLTGQAVADFFDAERGGFYLYRSDSEALIARSKESYDGAIPSGNSVMTMNLIWLNFLTDGKAFEGILDKQLAFMNAQATDMPGGHSFYLLSLLQKEFPDRKVIAALADPSEKKAVKSRLRGKGWAIIFDRETEGYRLKDAKTTYYICEKNVCHPPVNALPEYNSQSKF